MDQSYQFSEQNSRRSVRSKNNRVGNDSDLDISNPEIMEIINKVGLKDVTYEQLIEQKNDRIKGCQDMDAKLKDMMLRHWLTNRGKKHMIDFDEKERSKLKSYFKSLDEDGGGSIGLEELEDPLISLGIAESREEVKKIMDSVDDDQSGVIEFKEFLDIIKNKNSADGSEGKGTLIIDFFKDMINGKLGGGSGLIPKSLPFSLIISTIRRQKLLDAIMSQDSKKKEEGEKVMKAYGKLIAQRKQQKKDDRSEVKSQKSSMSKKK